MAAEKITLMGSAEIALRLGVTKERVYQLVNRRDFPLPYQRLLMGQVWDQADVEAWIREHRPHLVDPAAEDTEG